MPTHEETVARLAPSCTLGCVHLLVRLADMTRDRSDILVSTRFFFSSQDRSWLLNRQLIESFDWGYRITEKGKTVADSLLQRLKEMRL